MHPHLGMHSRRDHDATTSGQQHVGEKIIGDPVRRASQEICRGRRDDHEIGPLTEFHVRDLMRGLPQLTSDRLAGQSGPRRFAHEAKCGRRGHDCHVVTGLGQFAKKGDRFVRGDSAGDSEHDVGHNDRRAFPTRFPRPQRRDRRARRRWWRLLPLLLQRRPERDRMAQR